MAGFLIFDHKFLPFKLCITIHFLSSVFLERKMFEMNICIFYVGMNLAKLMKNTWITGGMYHMQMAYRLNQEQQVKLFITSELKQSLQANPLQLTLPLGALSMRLSKRKTLGHRSILPNFRTFNSGAPRLKHTLKARLQ
jgi:hypothetical protein